jgi:hypothetical protein
MAEFILDASVAISWCFPGDPTEDTPYSRRVLEKLLANDAVVPEVWAFEVANSIFVSFSKRKRISEQQITEYLSLLGALPIRVESQKLSSNIGLESLARRRNLTPMTRPILTSRYAPIVPLPVRMKGFSRRRLPRALRCLPNAFNCRLSWIRSLGHVRWALSTSNVVFSEGADRPP